MLYFILNKGEYLLSHFWGGVSSVTPIEAAVEAVLSLVSTAKSVRDGESEP